MWPYLNFKNTKLVPNPFANPKYFSIIFIKSVFKADINNTQNEPRSGSNNSLAILSNGE